MKKLLITVEGKKYEVLVETQGEFCSQAGASPVVKQEIPISVNPTPAPIPVVQKSAPTSGTEIPSPLAGKVVAINIATGQSVNQGDKIATLEAMKMNTFVTAPKAGKVSKIMISVGDAVTEGQPLFALS